MPEQRLCRTLYALSRNSGTLPARVDYLHLHRNSEYRIRPVTHCYLRDYLQFRALAPGRGPSRTVDHDSRRSFAAPGIALTVTVPRPMTCAAIVVHACSSRVSFGSDGPNEVLSAYTVNR